MYNKAILVGRLTQDPELKYTNTGVPVTKYGLAVNRTFKNTQGEQETDFFNIVTWRKLAEISAKYLKKGRLVLIEGRIQTRKYQAQDGSPRTTFEIHADQMQMLETKGTKAEEAGFTSAGKEVKDSAPSIPSDFSNKSDDDFDKMGPEDLDFEDVPF